MSSTAKKWGIGCSIGCGVVLLILGGIGTCGYVGVKKIVDRADTMGETFDQLDAEFGEPREFTPPVDGRIPADRMEVFLSVRDEMVVARDDAAGILRILDDDESARDVGTIVAKIKAGVSLIPSMMNYLDSRNSVMLEQGMGLGEYQYIYSLAYFDYLDKEPADGPSFRLNGPDDEEDADKVRWGVHVDSESGDVREERNRTIRYKLNENLAAMARNQLEALSRELAGSDDADLLEWREALAAEVEAMDSESRRILWEVDLPQRIADSIAPFADRLEASYDPTLNVVEMGMVDHN